MTDEPDDLGDPGDLGAERRLQLELRRRLREVDDLTPPPAPDFAARAIAAARDAELGSVPAPEDVPAPERTVVALPRRRWPRVLAGAAAAVAVGALALPGLVQLSRSQSSGSSASSPASAPEVRVQAGTAAGPTQARTDLEQGPSSPTSAPRAADLPTTADAATSTTPDPDALAAAVARLREVLVAPPYDATSVTLRSGPTRVEVVAPGAGTDLVQVAVRLLPAGTPVVVLQQP